MPKFCKFLFLLVFISNFSIAQKKADKEDWQPLFNGKDLTGWDIKIAGHKVNDNYKNTFIVEDKMIRVNYKEYDKFTTEYGHMYYNKPFSHYKIRLQYRFTVTIIRFGSGIDAVRFCQFAIDIHDGTGCTKISGCSFAGV